MGFIDLVKARARADKKTIVLPESMDRRTWEAAETILKEDIANLIIIGTPEDIADHSKGLDVSGATVININTASEQELMTLSGIGQAKAQQIIQYREENGLFDTPEDLMNVSGIGEKSFETLKDSIKVK